MGNVIYEGDDFKRMLRKDMLKLQQLVDAKKLGSLKWTTRKERSRLKLKEGR
jgi:hypothetical protein